MEANYRESDAEAQMPNILLLLMIVSGQMNGNFAGEMPKFWRGLKTGAC